MKLSAILPLPAAVAAHPASVLTSVEGEPVLVRIVRALAAVVDTVLVPTDDMVFDEVRSGLAATPAVVFSVSGSPSSAACLAASTVRLHDMGITHVLVADHGHPVLASGVIDRVRAALAGGAELVVPVLPVTDTVKSVDAHGTIESTVDRSQLTVTQYPYGVTLSRLAGLDAVLGAGPVTVAGDADGIAFDLPADAALLAAVISCRR